ncbi:hypothetical protein [Streptococcus agalactiae]|uniref:hypothetical protein n=1 Tax=Streptococcus agalactiae TaxID=1311 RepID=UPI0036D42305
MEDQTTNFSGLTVNEEIYESSRYWQSRYSDLMSDYLKEAEENIELKKQLKRLKAENWQLKHRKRK